MVMTTIIDWNASDTASMLGYVTGLLDDLKPLLTPIIGIGIGLIVFAVIVAVIRGRH